MVESALAIVLVLSEGPKPTGEVSAVCWALMGAIVIGMGVPLGWLNKKNGELEKKIEAKDAENDRLRDERLGDKEKLLAQAHVTLNTLMAKKRGESPS